MKTETKNLELTLDDENEFYDIETFNENFRKIDAKVNLELASGSFFGLIQDVSFNSNDAFWGKNNNYVCDLGKQLAQIAHFYNPNLDISTAFSNLITCDTIQDIVENDDAKTELHNVNFETIIKKSPYASDLLFKLTIDYKNYTIVNPAISPMISCDFSPDGHYFGVGTEDSSVPTFFIRENASFTKVPILPIPIGMNIPCKMIKFSHDSIYVATLVSVAASKHIDFYKREGETFTELSNPTLSWSGYVNAMEFSRDGKFLAVAHDNAPYITVCKREGDLFTKLPAFETTPGESVTSCCFSYDGKFLVVGTSNSIIIYKITGETFTYFYPTGISVGYNVVNCCFSPDGKYLTFTYRKPMAPVTSPSLLVLKIEEEEVTTLSTMPSLSTGVVNAMEFSQDGRFLAIARAASPYLTIIKRSGDSFTKLSNPPTLPSGAVRGMRFASDGLLPDESLFVGCPLVSSVHSYKYKELLYLD